MNLPNFLIIGAAKAGTTSLYHYLKQHPQIYMSPIKEPRFFAFDGKEPYEKGPRHQDPRIYSEIITNIENYSALFQGVKDEIAIGEASGRYLHDPKAPENIHHYIPHVKMIAILRHPVDRAYSHFWMLIREGHEPIKNFIRALKAEEKRIRKNWGPGYHYKSNGFYFVQLKRYFNLFDRNQIKIYLYDDLSSDSLGLMQKIFQFLGVDDKFVPEVSKKHNESEFTKKNVLHELLTMRSPIKTILKPLVPQKIREQLHQIKSKTIVKPPPLPSETRKELTNIFREDILRLQDLIQRDLSKWLG